MKITESFARLASGAHSADFQHEERQRRRSSFDNLVIPNRTRLPSGQVSQVERVDLQIAMNLLKAQAHASPATPLMHPASLPPQTRQNIGEMAATNGEEQSSRPATPYSFNRSFNLMEAQELASTINDFSSHRPHNTGTSDHRHSPTMKPHRTSKSGSGSSGHDDLRPSYDSAIDFPSDLSTGTAPVLQMGDITASRDPVRTQPGQSVDEYNALAKTHGINPITVINDYVNIDALESVHTEGGKNTGLSRIKEVVGDALRGNKKLRQAPSTQSLKSIKSTKDTTIMSTKDTTIFQSSSLEDICRLGGVGGLKLVKAFSPTEELEIPTALAALAKHIVSEGPLIPEVFRLSGSHNTVNQLADHFATQFIKNADVRSPDRVELTVCISELPTNIEYSIHDIASVYKRIIRELPGGLLGSLELFNALKDIQSKSSIDPIARISMIALALSSLSSDNRFSIICATLGLFAWIGHATATAVNAPKQQLMSHAAFATILLPMLISQDLQINVQVGEIQHGVEVSGHSMPTEYMREAGDIANMLLSNWTDVVFELRALGLSSRTREPSDEMQQQRLTGTTTTSQNPQPTSEADAQEQKAASIAPLNPKKSVSYAPTSSSEQSKARTAAPLIKAQQNQYARNHGALTSGKGKYLYSHPGRVHGGVENQRPDALKGEYRAKMKEQSELKKVIGQIKGFVKGLKDAKKE